MLYDHDVLLCKQHRLVVIRDIIHNKIKSLFSLQAKEAFFMQKKRISICKVSEQSWKTP